MGKQKSGEKWTFLRQAFRNAYFSMLPLARSRKKYILRHQVFASCGEGLFWQPRKLPSDPKCIKLHDNVIVASDVTFINHDVIYLLMRGMGDKEAKEHLECIEVMDNVFIGLGAKILPGVRIGPNAIIAAGSVVTKDVAPGTVVGGTPARVIGRFEDVLARRREETAAIAIDDRFDDRRVRQAWEAFYAAHDAAPGGEA